MFINGVNLIPNYEDRVWLDQFFTENMKYIKDKDLSNYENLKAFGDLYEKFIDENNLRENDFLKLFLLEMRYLELTYKITKKSEPHLNFLTNPSSIKNLTNSPIAKWYKESKVVHQERRKLK